MSKTIDFCISYVGYGIELIENLIENLISTSSAPENIKIYVSYHDDVDLSILKKSKCFDYVYATVYARSYEKSISPFIGSANHSSALNAMARVANSDIVIFSDYDMAFLVRNWDAKLIDYLNENRIDVLGVSYSDNSHYQTNTLKISSCLWLAKVPVKKYQKLPNLSFFVVSRLVLATSFKKNLTNFDSFLINNGFPFRLINTKMLEFENNLPLGTMQWLDTGYEIPEIIRKNNLNTAVLAVKEPTNLIPFVRFKLFWKRRSLNSEVFCLPDTDQPYLIHLSKGTGKMGLKNARDLLDNFTKKITHYLDN